MSNNIFADVANDIRTHTGSYVGVIAPSSKIPDPGMSVGDVLLLLMSLLLVLRIFFEVQTRYTPIRKGEGE